MRHAYPLTKETIKVVNGHAAAVAEEMDVSDKYVYGILAGTNPDPFAYFYPFYKAVTRAGLDTTPIDARLAEAKAKAKGIARVDEKTLITQKIALDAETSAHLVEASADGHWDEREQEKIRLNIERIRKNCDEIERKMNEGTEPTIRAQAQQKVAARRLSAVGK